MLKPTLRVKNFFGVKDVLSLGLRSHAVYKFTCGGCNSSYIGYTTRHMSVRAGAEHCGVSWRTGRRIKPLQESAVAQHALCSGHAAELINFEILNTCDSVNDLKLLESLNIKLLKPDLNTSESSIPLQLF